MQDVVATAIGFSGGVGVDAVIVRQQKVMNLFHRQLKCAENEVE